MQIFGKFNSQSTDYSAYNEFKQDPEPIIFHIC